MYTSRFRLNKSMPFIREDGNETPGTIIFVAAEGDETERCYFQHLQTCIKESGTLVNIYIEFLTHMRDGKSAPPMVLELLDECTEIKREGIVSRSIEDYFQGNATREELEQYVENPSLLSQEKSEKIENMILGAGIDFAYRKYLTNYRSFSGDRFIAVIDRDAHCHKREELEKCIQICRKKHYELYLTNPCFEFWLLLHLCDVKEEYGGKEKCFLANKHVSNEHTFTSKEVSKRANHGKKISLDCFRKNYWGNILTAQRHAKEYKTDLEMILDDVGTNLGQLFKDELRKLLPNN